jgi:hypothetical protein
MMLRADFYIGENFTQINGLEFNCNAAVESEVKIQQNEKLSKEIKRVNASFYIIQLLCSHFFLKVHLHYGDFLF